MSARPTRAAFYRPAEVARMLRCSEWWVKEQARRRRIPFCWIGGSYLFTDEHIAAIVLLFEVMPDDAPPSGRRVSAVRRGQADDDSTPPQRLRARPPRRARGSRSTAA